MCSVTGDVFNREACDIQRGGVHYVAHMRAACSAACATRPESGSGGFVRSVGTHFGERRVRGAGLL